MTTQKKTVQLPAATVAEVVQISKDSMEKLDALKERVVDEMGIFKDLLFKIDCRVTALEQARAKKAPARAARQARKGR